jgi:hypothetical protein
LARTAFTFIERKSREARRHLEVDAALGRIELHVIDQPMRL